MRCFLGKGLHWRLSSGDSDVAIATWHCHKNFSQWECCYHWKLRCYWLNFLRQRQFTVIIQGPGIGTILMTCIKLMTLLWSWQVIYMYNCNIIFIFIDLSSAINILWYMYQQYEWSIRFCNVTFNWLLAQQPAKQEPCLKIFVYKHGFEHGNLLATQGGEP